MIFEGLLNAPSTAHGTRSAAATKLRRSRCCDGDAQTSSVALILRVAYGADAAATELRRPAPSRSFCASRWRDVTRRMRRMAFIFPRVDLNSMVVAHSPRPPPWPRNK